jgi:hypothetical protein
VEKGSSVRQAPVQLSDCNQNRCKQAFLRALGFNPGRLAQLGERLPYKQEVGGSIPSPPTQKGSGNRAFLIPSGRTGIENEAVVESSWKARLAGVTPPAVSRPDFGRPDTAVGAGSILTR